jgi:hypothetical protein
VHDSNEFIIQILTLATSLNRNEIEDLSSLELRNLVELVQKMTEYDISLYPYLSPFTTTLTSENLWHSRGTGLTSFENKLIELPDGATIKIMCVYREQAKLRLDASWNALLQVRPLAGKSADPLASELKTVARQLVADNNEAWEGVVKVKAASDLDDGWAHPENMETKEGMLKELHGMMSNDRHERFFSKFEKRQIDEAEGRRQALESIIQRKGGPGIHEEVIRVETETEFRKRELDLKKGKVSPTPISRDKTETIGLPEDKLKKYQQ